MQRGYPPACPTTCPLVFSCRSSVMCPLVFSSVLHTNIPACQTHCGICSDKDQYFNVRWCPYRCYSPYNRPVDTVSAQLGLCVLGALTTFPVDSPCTDLLTATGALRTTWNQHLYNIHFLMLQPLTLILGTWLLLSPGVVRGSTGTHSATTLSSS